MCYHNFTTAHAVYWSHEARGLCCTYVIPERKTGQCVVPLSKRRFGPFFFFLADPPCHGSFFIWWSVVVHFNLKFQDNAAALCACFGNPGRVCGIYSLDHNRPFARVLGMCLYGTWAIRSAGRFKIIATRRVIETIATRHIQSKREI